MYDEEDEHSDYQNYLSRLRAADTLALAEDNFTVQTFDTFETDSFTNPYDERLADAFEDDGTEENREDDERAWVQFLAGSSVLFERYNTDHQVTATPRHGRFNTDVDVAIETVAENAEVLLHEVQGVHAGYIGTWGCHITKNIILNHKIEKAEDAAMRIFLSLRMVRKEIERHHNQNVNNNTNRTIN